MTPFVIEPIAREDLLKASEYYERQRAGLGFEFFEAVDDALLKMSDRPKSFPIYHRNARRVLLDRFPYLVLFVEHDAFISVIGVIHGARNPATIRGRIH